MCEKKIKIKGHDPTQHESGQEAFKISQVKPGRVRIEKSRVGLGRVGSDRVGSDRIGSCRIGSGRVGSDRFRWFFRSRGSGQAFFHISRVGSDRDILTRPDP